MVCCFFCVCFGGVCSVFGFARVFVCVCFMLFYRCYGMIAFCVLVLCLRDMCLHVLFVFACGLCLVLL